MEAKPLVSVLMSCFNEPIDFICQSIESILNQTFTDFEFIILLDNPNNENIKKCLYRYEKQDERIHVFVNDMNIGLPLTLNKGLGFCKGKYIARMDADDISEQIRLAEELEFLLERNYDIVSSCITSFNENNEKKLIKLPLLNEECIDLFKKGNCLAHPSWFLKKDVYNELNGYRNIFACEDYDFLLRATLKGFKLGNVPKSLLNYRINTLGISQKNQGKQNVCSEFLAKYYRKGKSPTIDEITKYMASRRAQYAISNYSFYLENTKLYFLSDSKKDKIFYLMKLSFNWFSLKKLIGVVINKIGKKLK